MMGKFNNFFGPMVNEEQYDCFYCLLRYFPVVVPQFDDAMNKTNHVSFYTKA
jgi:hypothetical protein